YSFYHKLIAEIVHERAPGTPVVGLSSVHARRAWTQRVIETAGGEIGDIASIHNYLNGQPPERLLKTRIEGLLGPDRAYLRDAGRSDMPVWDTESGYFLNEDRRPRDWGVPEFYWKTPVEHAQYNVRQYLLSFAFGLEQRNLFTLLSVNHGRWNPHSIFRPDHLESARPAAVAVANLAWALSDARPMGLHLTARDGAYAYEFHDAVRGRQLWVVWTAGTPTAIDLAGEAPVEARDMYGRALPLDAHRDQLSIVVGGSPVYLWFDSSVDLPAVSDAGFVPFGDYAGPRTRQEDRAAAYPVDPTRIIYAADVEHFRWSPGLTETLDRPGRRLVLKIDRPIDADAEPMAASFQVVMAEGQSGRYDIWAAVEPMFPTRATKLRLRVNGDLLPVPRGLDQPATYEIQTQAAGPQTLAWEFLGSVELVTGGNELSLIPVIRSQPGGQGPQAFWRQTCDQILLHRSSPPNPQTGTR
ncbi:MAG: hypothetical protein AAF593_17505, partial [Planctomycetota bacterium]